MPAPWIASTFQPNKKLPPSGRQIAGRINEVDLQRVDWGTETEWVLWNIGCLRLRVQFSRVITPVEEIQLWSATSHGFSFVISFAGRVGPGFHGKLGFLASWRPILQNRSAIKVIGSPFKTFSAAEQACETMLGYLKEQENRPTVRSPLLARDALTMSI